MTAHNDANDRIIFRGVRSMRNTMRKTARARMLKTTLATLVAAVAAVGIAAPAQAAAPAWKVIGVTAPTHIPPAADVPSAAEIVVRTANMGTADIAGTVTVEVGPLPAGVTTSAAANGTDGSAGAWSCAGSAAGQTSATCVLACPPFNPSCTLSIPPGKQIPSLRVPVSVDASAVSGSTVPVSISGGGALPSLDGNDSFDVPLTISPVPAEPGMDVVWAGALDADGALLTQAGGHPTSAAAFFQINTVRKPNGRIGPAGAARDLDVALPPGFIGNPLVTFRCPQSDRHGEALGTPDCPSDAVVGRIHASLFAYPGPGEFQPLYNDIPAFGYPAQFTFPFVGAVATQVASLRSDDDYGVTVKAPRLPGTGTFWGAFAWLNGNPPGAGGKAFLTNPTSCADESPVTNFAFDTWQAPLDFNGKDASIPQTTGCDQLVFEPSFGFQPDTSSPAAPAGATADLSVPQDRLLDPEELASPHLKKSVVTLPEGLVLNPSAANGLEACSTGQIGLIGTGFGEPNPIRFDKTSPACPDGSKVGTAVIDTPLIEEPLEGTVYLAKQGDNPFGSLIALYLVVDNDRYGIHVKLPGKVDLDQATGRVTATFDHNPQVPFSNLKLVFRGGERGTLSTPDVCGDYDTTGSWTPWSAPESGPPAETSDPFSIAGDGCASSKTARGFALGFDAGATSQAGGAFAPFTLRLTRPDGDQEVDRLEVKTPRGLLASLRGVPYCSEAGIAQATGRTADGDGAIEQASPSCPAASQIGATTVGAGTGPSPYFATGKAYLAGAYKGAPLSMVFVVPAVAGPFDLGVQVVRAALQVDRSTAQVTAVSDPVPQILQGVPLQIKDIRVDLDRPGFTINPTSCAQKQIETTATGGSGATSTLTKPFQASGCARLPFEPNLTLALTGKRQVTTGKHPGVRAQVNQTGVGEAGVEKVVVRLPKSLALDPNNAQALCEFADGTKPDLENHCPKGSIVGRARAKSPLLKNDLVGDVYFVKNIRTDPVTGNQIRTLPMIIVALRGEVALNLKGESDTTKSGRLVNTFANVPDAPINQFNLNINGGTNGILAVTRTRRAKINLCAGRHVAEADIDGQNGRQHDTDIRMKTPCTAKQTKAAKRAARQAARRR